MSSSIQEIQRNNRQIALWLFVVCALIFAMVVLGGVTRLTRSGLSMVEWQPIMGIVPPLTQEAWQSTFEKYQQFPEYQKLNKGMSLDEFKSIFWFEYAHRILGRTIGLAFLLPFLYFWVRRRISRPLVPKLVIMFILGGLQGLLGWYMVQSGLVDKPHVSQYRLTAHLMAAVLIYGYILWVGLGLIKQEQQHALQDDQAALRHLGIVVTALIALMMISGGFVAGTRAGFAFNTFPTMNGYWIPPGIVDMQPVWLNFLENITTIQFTHRWLALLVAGIIVAYWIVALRRMAPGSRGVFHLLMAALVLQIGLGISTLLQAVPVPLAAAHQAGALLLITAALLCNHSLRRSQA